MRTIGVGDIIGVVEGIIGEDMASVLGELFIKFRLFLLAIFSIWSWRNSGSNKANLSAIDCRIYLGLWALAISSSIC